MSRKEQIEKAAREWTSAYGQKGEYPISMAAVQEVAFEAGAMFADANPIKYGGFTDDQFGRAPLHIHDECQFRYEVLRGQHAFTIRDYLDVKKKLNIAIKALKEKADLEPGHRMHENIAAGLALKEIERLDND